MRVDPVRDTLNAPATRHLILKYDQPVSEIGFNFNLRRYIKAAFPSWRHHAG